MSSHQVASTPEKEVAVRWGDGVTSTSPKSPQSAPKTRNYRAYSMNHLTTSFENLFKISTPKVREILSRSNSFEELNELLRSSGAADDLDELGDRSRLWSMMSDFLETDVATIQRKLSDHVEYTLARDRSSFDEFACYQATALSIRDRLIEFWNDTNFRFAEENPKRVYYLSIEYLMGRSLNNALLNLNIKDNYARALKGFGYLLEDLFDQESDAGLGNGGLGRLAACYLDSLATQNYAAWGYGIRYTYGMFRQEIFLGWQAEVPDRWLAFGNPWEITRVDVKLPVRFGGEVSSFIVDGVPEYSWEGGETVLALAHDTPVPGFNTPNTINLRLWSSEPSNEFDLQSFNEGNYSEAVARRQSAENISSVLYPSDSKSEGKELRLKQQYFFVSATLQDVIRRFKKRNSDFNTFPDKVAIQLNDTHPTISIAELIRLLVDVEKLDWETACSITKRTFAYTNHTVLPEALERWAVPLFQKLLPRHLQIIFDINARFLKEVAVRFPGDEAVLSRLSIIEESHPKQIRMANLAIVMSHSVNGVAAIHSDILQKSLFKEFNEMYPGKFLNITNGITQRRWLLGCNPRLTELIANTLGTDGFLTNLDILEQLRAHANNRKLQEQWLDVKLANKKVLAEYLQKHLSITVDPHSFFDIQVKRIHEYKRQLLNILRVIYLWQDLRAKSLAKQLDDVLPRVVIFAGKAAPSYHRAKLIIKLINSVAERVNNDRSINGLLKVVFIPNYSVSLAEIIVPASDISQHISTAGMEASGTSNMKFALNGGLIIGTLDGANIEIRDAIGHENMFIFGLTADQVGPTRVANAKKHAVQDPRLVGVIEAIRDGEFGDPSTFNEIVDSLVPDRDYFLLGDDFSSYVYAHNQVDRKFRNRHEWAKMSIMSTAGMGMFSSDRAIREYAEKIWDAKPFQWEINPLAKPSKYSGVAAAVDS
eukprot:TRINITY_DN5153_c1_g1_i2.p1 TRINITY_DN5153_c1_g1~~TRINITY_DN5153_c1_g1_i2.p1  ORF type:complete len:936 (-),score=339.56 TRINITY_DN5153_c1_g1_i2:247-3054(-)